MRIIAFVTQKGGAGKSTLASSVAVAAHAAGERVFIVDLDPLQTLVKWSDARADKTIGVEHIPAAKLAKALAALEKKGITLVVLDAPGQEGEQAEAAMRVADLCVIPARPNAFDLWASEKTRAHVKAQGCDYAFLLNQCPPAQQNARVALGAKALQAMGGLLAPLVSARVDYQEAARLGLGVCEYHPEGVAALEMKELWASIKRRLKRAPAKPAEKTAPAPKAAIKPAARPTTKPNAKAAAKETAREVAQEVAKEVVKTAAAAAPKAQAAAGEATKKPAAGKPAKKAA